MFTFLLFRGAGITERTTGRLFILSNVLRYGGVMLAAAFFSPMGVTSFVFVFGSIFTRSMFTRRKLSSLERLFRIEVLGPRAQVLWGRDN